MNKMKDVSGKNNPFYGKSHSLETIKIIKEKARITSLNKWQDPVYRNKVITNSSKPRHKNFGAEQSERIKKWYIDNPEQKEIRRESMSKKWKDGILKPNLLHPNSTSKIEKEFFNLIKECYPFIEKKYIKLLNGKNAVPDVLINDSYMIIEFFGDYWHANPEIYNENTRIDHKLAKDIWEYDEQRKYQLNLMGYDVYVVWESDFLRNKKQVIDSFNIMLNWEFEY